MSKSPPFKDLFSLQSNYHLPLEDPFQQSTDDHVPRPLQRCRTDSLSHACSNLLSRSPRRTTESHSPISLVHCDPAILTIALQSFILGIAAKLAGRLGSQEMESKELGGEELELQRSARRRLHEMGPDEDYMP